ncbi:MAG: hypothetical protein F6J92_22620 [Symploca sp. SIO1A3]|nr:hypothetical protein [Symploca sp. SIO1A3]
MLSMNVLPEDSKAIAPAASDPNFQDQPVDWSTAEDLVILEVDGEPVNHCSTCGELSSPENNNCPYCDAVFS